MPRIIYSLAFELEPKSPGTSRQVIAPLDSNGQCPHIAPRPPKQRTIDLRIGDWLQHDGKRHRILNVAAYREATVDQDYVPSEGYVVKG